MLGFSVFWQEYITSSYNRCLVHSSPFSLLTFVGYSVVSFLYLFKNVPRSIIFLAFGMSCEYQIQYQLPVVLSVSVIKSVPFSAISFAHSRSCECQIQYKLPLVYFHFYQEHVTFLYSSCPQSVLWLSNMLLS